MPSRCCIQYISKFGRPNSVHRIGKPIPILKKGSSKECSNHQTMALISHASNVMFKILHARLQHYANQKLPDIKAGFREGRGIRDQIANICWII